MNNNINYNESAEVLSGNTNVNVTPELDGKCDGQECCQETR